MKSGHSVTIKTTSEVAPRGKGYKKEGTPKNELNIMCVRSLVNIPDTPITLDIGYGVENFDIVWLQEEFPLMNAINAVVARRKKVPVLCVVARYYYPWNPLKRLCINFLDKTVLRSVRNCVDLFVVRTKDAWTFMRKLKVPESKMRLIPSGVDCTAFRPFKSDFLRDLLDLEDDDIIITYVARFHPYKGHRILLYVAKRARAPNMHFVFVGKGSRKLESSIKTNIIAMGLKENVHILESVFSNEKMPLIYNSSDIYVHPSLIEPFGISPLEAQACGVPVVAFSTGGLKHIVAHNQTGLLAPLGHIGEFAKSVFLLASEKGIREEYGENARKRTAEIFDWRKITDKYAMLLEKMNNLHTS
jgi:glycosyltransferase involved in cell wall biosynthesis